VLIREPRVVHRREAKHEAGRGEDFAEDEVVRHFQNEAQERREREQIDEGVRPEAEEGVHPSEQKRTAPVQTAPALGFTNRQHDGNPGQTGTELRG